MTKGKFIKALLLNGLVFPGAGYFVLNRRIRGFMLCSLVTFIFITLFFHIILVARLVQQSLPPLIVGNLQDVVNYNLQISNQVLSAHGEILKTYLYLLLFCYGFGVFDLIFLFVTEKKEKADLGG